MLLTTQQLKDQCKYSDGERGLALSSCWEIFFHHSSQLMKSSDDQQPQNWAVSENCEDGVGMEKEWLIFIQKGHPGRNLVCNDIGGLESVNFPLLNSTNVYWKGLKGNMKL